MPGSYKRVNYRLRPAKNIERKMMVDVLRKLDAFGKLRSYRYIGFGSAFFSDFSLVHKALGITEMVSIEKDVEDRARFVFNAPFVCVRMRFGHSNNILPLLNWRLRTILWLDYDSKLMPSVFADIGHFCARARPGSVIIITVNANPGAVETDRVEQLRLRLGADRVPGDLSHAQLADWGTARVYQRIIRNEILQRIAERSLIEPLPKRLRYMQLFNFHYADSAKMLTVGGLIYEGQQEDIVERCGFKDHFDFVRTGTSPYVIDLPHLTMKELHFLDAQLPLRKRRRLKRQGITAEEARNYSRVYRYFPRFTEAEL